MRRLAAGLIVASFCSSPALAQEGDRSVERTSLALQRQSPDVSITAEPAPSPMHLGIFTLVPPTGRGDIIRVSIPIGELMSRAFEGVRAANERRKAAAVRREVETALKAFLDQQPKFQH